MRLLLVLFLCSNVYIHATQNDPVESKVVHTLGELYRLSSWLNRFFEDMHTEGGCMNVLCLNSLVDNLHTTSSNLTTYKIKLYSTMDTDQQEYVPHTLEKTDGLSTLHDTMILLNDNGLLPAVSDVTRLLGKVLECHVTNNTYRCYVHRQKLPELTDLCVGHGAGGCTDSVAGGVRPTGGIPTISSEGLDWKFIWTSDPDGISKVLRTLHRSEASYQSDPIIRVLHENKYYTHLVEDQEFSPVLSADLKEFIHRLIDAFQQVPGFKTIEGDLYNEAKNASRSYRTKILHVMKVVHKVTAFYMEQQKFPGKPLQLSRSILHLQLQLSILTNFLVDFINSPESSSHSFIMNKFFSPTGIPQTDDAVGAGYGDKKIIKLRINHLQEQLPTKLKEALWEFVSMVWVASSNKSKKVGIVYVLEDMPIRSEDFLLLAYQSLKSLSDLDSVLETDHNCSLLRSGATLKEFLHSPINSSGTMDICQKLSTSSLPTKINDKKDNPIIIPEVSKTAGAHAEDVTRYEKKEDKSTNKVKNKLDNKHTVNYIQLNKRLEAEYEKKQKNKSMWDKELMHQSNGDASYDEEKNTHDTSSKGSSKAKVVYISQDSAPASTSTTLNPPLEEFEVSDEGDTREMGGTSTQIIQTSGTSAENTTEPVQGAPSQEEPAVFGHSAIVILGCTAGLVALVVISACIYKRRNRSARTRGYSSTELQDCPPSDTAHRYNRRQSYNEIQ